MKWLLFIFPGSVFVLFKGSLTIYQDKYSKASSVCFVLVQMTYVLHWLPSVDLCEWTSLNILWVWLTQCPLPNLTSCHEEYPPHIHPHLSTHICAYSNMNTHESKPHMMTVCPFGELSAVLKSSRTKKHILQLSCRHLEGEVGGVLRRKALPEDLHASSAQPIDCSDEPILIWRSRLIGRTAVKDSHLNDCVKRSLIWKLLTWHIFLPRRRHFSVYLVWVRSSQIDAVRYCRGFFTPSSVLDGILPGFLTMESAIARNAFEFRDFSDGV